MDYKKLVKVTDSKQGISVGDFSDILKSHGYSYVDWEAVKAKDGRTGTRYRLDKDRRNPDAEGLKKELESILGDKVIFSGGYNKYAPEQKVESVIILDSKIRFVNHGEWADPEYTDGKKVANYYDVEEYLYSIWKDAGNKGSVEEFNEWLKAHPEELEAAFGEVAHDEDSITTEVANWAEALGDSKKAVKDDADITKAVEFCIDEDNVYDLIHEGETSVAIPSGADTKAFVAAVEDILKEVASDCGVKGLKVETEIVGNRVNVIKK